jgi:uncharacterized protein YidB (DUF937 family)
MEAAAGAAASLDAPQQFRKLVMMEKAMGLLDTVGSALKGALGLTDATDVSALISGALQKSNLGDLQGLVTKLEQGGLTNQVQSWLGNGANLPVSAQQLQAALGNDQLKQLAVHFGLPVDSVTKLLADRLPTVVDQASPDGTVQTPQ